MTFFKYFIGMTTHLHQSLSERMRVILALTGFVEERHHTFSRTDLSNVVVDWDCLPFEMTDCLSRMVKNAKKKGRKTLAQPKRVTFAELPGVFFFPWRIGLFPTTFFGRNFLVLFLWRTIQGALHSRNRERTIRYHISCTYFLQLGDARGAFKTATFSIQKYKMGPKNSFKWE